MTKKAYSASKDIHEFLEEKYLLYNRPSFIESDPVSIPHLFRCKEDREIAGFLAATIAWGQRPTILRNAARIMQMMENSPYEFLMNSTEKDFAFPQASIHRTFNTTDLSFFFRALQQIYKKHGGLEAAFSKTGAEPGDECRHAIMNFRRLFFSSAESSRSAKHVSDPSSGSSSKRLCMFLRWMVRKDSMGVDFGIWRSETSLLPSELMCPLDVHSGNTARKLGLLVRKQNDWKAVQELTQSLRELDPLDPVKYDIALFGLGVFEKF